jgi:hypothetical protein
LDCLSFFVIWWIIRQPHRPHRSMLPWINTGDYINKYLQLLNQFCLTSCG